VVGGLVVGWRPMKDRLIDGDERLNEIMLASFDLQRLFHFTRHAT
jgi:hypothetical protein